MMMNKFSVRPTLTLRGRSFKGVGGWSGKPTHPPLTDVPIAAYVLAAIFDLIAVFGRNQTWSRDFFVAGTFLFIAGAIVSIPTALTGFWDWLQSTTKGTQVRRTANAHAWAMILVTMLVVVDIVLRLRVYRTDDYPTVAVLVLSIVIAAVVALGASLGGSLVFDHGFNVETAGDSAAWHVSEIDVLPGQLDPVEDNMSPAERLSDLEEAITSKTPDPLAESS